MNKVTRKQAEQVLEAVKQMFPYDADAFALFDHEHEDLPEGAWSIAGEGVWEPILGDWPFAVIEKHFIEKQDNGTSPFGDVYLECLTHWCLAIYPN